MEMPPTDSAPGAPAPKTFGDLFSESLDTYGHGAAVLTGIALVALVPLALFQGAAWAANASSGSGDIGLAARAMLVSLAFLVLTILAYPVMGGALIHAAVRRREGRPVGVPDAYSHALSKAGRLIGAELLVFLLLMLIALPFILLSLLLLALLGYPSWPWPSAAPLLAALPLLCYFGVKWMLASQIVLLEGSKARESLGRSSALIAGHWWRSFGFSLLLGAVPSLLLGIPIELIFSAVSLHGFASTVVQGIFPGVITMPLSTVALTILYFDLRARMLQSTPRLMPEVAPAPPPEAGQPPGPGQGPPAPGGPYLDSRRVRLC